MRREWIIQKYDINENKPVICVPIIERKREAILAAARALRQQQIEMIEWRADYFEDGEDIEEILAVLSQLNELLMDAALLYTYRSKAQGGNGGLEWGRYEVMLEKIAVSNYADFIDVEFFQLKNPKHCIQYIKAAGNYALASHHNFNGTEAVSCMTEQLIGMHQSGADIVKLAVMPRDIQDVLNLLQATVNIKKAFPLSRVVTMSMGAKGVVTRLAGESFGSCITFSYYQGASAPGQMCAEDVKIILDKIHSAQGVPADRDTERA